MSTAPAIVVFTAGGATLAQRLAAALPGARIHAFKSRTSAADETFGDAAAHLRALFAAGTPIVGICAAGILIRTLAPALGDKQAEPPVVAVAENGSIVVPLLGGHRGGNDLARRIAGHLGGVAAITTASDTAFGVALDAPPAGFSLANPGHLKDFTAALLAGSKVCLVGEAPWLAASSLPFAPDGALEIPVTERALAGTPSCLVYHPRTLAVGVGCERGTPEDAIADHVRACLAEAGLAAQAVAGFFSIDLKADEPGLHTAAATFGVPVRFFPAARLEAERARLLNPSEAVFRETGCHGVAEGAALAAAGAAGRLVLPKRIGSRVTCAIALAPAPIDAGTIGQARGELFVVGIGPGDAASLTGEAAALIERATDLVGYGLYLDLLGARADGKPRHAYALGEETGRVKAALQLAAQGRRVALVSSGDPGIYAMASLVFETLETAPDPDWRRVRVQVAPGISALQAAAARAGAPIGHDFCAISLSDLLTDWQAIERRIVAAAEADFVIGFFNPASQRRTWQLARARDILLAHRPPETPVILARELGRPGERVRMVELGALVPAEIDMLTLVLVGSSTTRALPDGAGRTWVYTPRGYAAKTTQEAR